MFHRRHTSGLGAIMRRSPSRIGSPGRVPLPIPPHPLHPTMRRRPPGLGGASSPRWPCSPPALADCPGAQRGVPVHASSQTGQRGCGVLRFPQAIAIGPDGNVYVSDQGSHRPAVPGRGTCMRDIGAAGSGPAS